VALRAGSTYTAFVESVAAIAEACAAPGPLEVAPFPLWLGLVDVVGEVEPADTPAGGPWFTPPLACAVASSLASVEWAAA